MCKNYNYRRSSEHCTHTDALPGRPPGSFSRSRRSVCRLLELRLIPPVGRGVIHPSKEDVGCRAVVLLLVWRSDHILHSHTVSPEEEPELIKHVTFLTRFTAGEPRVSATNLKPLLRLKPEESEAGERLANSFQPEDYYGGSTAHVTVLLHYYSCNPHDIMGCIKKKENSQIMNYCASTE